MSLDFLLPQGWEQVELDFKFTHEDDGVNCDSLWDYYDRFFPEYCGTCGYKPRCDTYSFVQEHMPAEPSYDTKGLIVINRKKDGRGGNMKLHCMQYFPAQLELDFGESVDDRL